MKRMAAWLLIAALIYLGLGLGFHIKWKGTLEACRAERQARGEFVEPKVLPLPGIFFDVTSWPVYVRANLRHAGTPFATPCD